MAGKIILELSENELDEVQYGLVNNMTMYESELNKYAHLDAGNKNYSIALLQNEILRKEKCAENVLVKINLAVKGKCQLSN